MLRIIPVLILAIHPGVTLSDPCVDYTPINDTRRSAGYVTDLTEPAICDASLSKGWYRFTSDAGDKIPENCVEANHCGTIMPVRLNNPVYPATIGDERDLEACVTFPSRKRSSSCCDYTTNIRTRKCDGFFVYQLAPLPTCPMAYCAGDKQPCPAGFYGMEPNCEALYPKMTTAPKLTGPEKEENSFYFSCEIDIEDHPDHYFRVNWTFNGTAVPNLSNTTQDKIVRLNGTKLKGHLDQDIGCQVQTFFKDRESTPSPWTKSNTYWAGIRVEPRHLTIGEDEDEKKVSIIFTVPKVCEADIPKDQCLLKLTPFMQSLLPVNERKGEELVITDTCSYDLRPEDWCDEKNEMRKEIKIKASRNHMKDGDRQVFLAFKKIMDLGIFQDHLIPAVHVDVKDAEERSCIISGDPHIQGMEYTRSQWYNMYRIGDYTVYQNEERKFEVQIRTYMCRRNLPVSCVCGVAIREYDDIVIIENCANLGINNYRPSPRIIKPRGALSDGASVSVRTDGKEIVVYLPSSAEVKVVAGWAFSVYITVPGSDKGKGEGICGTFDGKDYNEFRFRGGARTDMACEKRDDINDMGCVPEGFTESWRVSDADNLFKRVPESSPRNITQIYCVCDATEDDSMRCSARADVPNDRLTCGNGRTCIRDGGKHFRRRRSVEGNVYTDLNELSLISDYNPEDFQDMQTPNYTWPTPSGYTKKGAEEMCLSAIQQSQLWSHCQTVLTGNVTLDIEDCVLDILLMDSNETLENYVASFMASCQAHLATDPANYVTDSNGTVTLKAEISKEVCDQPCFKNGRCDRGRCICNPGFTGDNCLLLSGKGPQLHKFQDSSICDINLRPCELIRIEASNLELTDDLTCKVQEILPDGTVSATPTIVAAEFFTNVEIACHLPEPGLKSDRSLKTFVISASMDGNLYGNGLNWTVFDSLCQNCSELSCQKLPDTCLINDLCYVDGDLNQDRDGEICDISRNTTQWTSLYPELLSVDLSVTDGGVKCTADASSTSPPARFKVAWYVDDHLLRSELRVVSGEKHGFLSTQGLSGSRLTCKMRSYYDDGRGIYSPYLTSNSFDLTTLNT